jgi:hypothetical protein
MLLTVAMYAQDVHVATTIFCNVHFNRILPSEKSSFSFLSLRNSREKRARAGYRK